MYVLRSYMQCMEVQFLSIYVSLKQRLHREFNFQKVFDSNHPSSIFDALLGRAILCWFQDWRTGHRCHFCVSANLFSEEAEDSPFRKDGVRFLVCERDLWWLVVDDFHVCHVCQMARRIGLSLCRTLWIEGYPVNVLLFSFSISLSSNKSLQSLLRTDLRNTQPNTQTFTGGFCSKKIRRPVSSFSNHSSTKTSRIPDPLRLSSEVPDASIVCIQLLLMITSWARLIRWDLGWFFCHFCWRGGCCGMVGALKIGRVVQTYINTFIIHILQVVSCHYHFFPPVDEYASTHLYLDTHNTHRCFFVDAFYSWRGRIDITILLVICWAYFDLGDFVKIFLLAVTV